MGQVEDKDDSRKQIRLSNRGLLSLPTNLLNGRKEDTDILNLNYNYLSDLPHIDRYFPFLSRLYLGSNRFTKIPETVPFLKELTLLVCFSSFILLFIDFFLLKNLSNNGVEEFKHFVLPKLRCLDLSDNKISAFIHDIQVLFPLLETFNLERNWFNCKYLLFFQYFVIFY